VDNIYPTAGLLSQASLVHVQLQVCSDLRSALLRLVMLFPAAHGAEYGGSWVSALHWCEAALHLLHSVHNRTICMLPCRHTAVSCTLVSLAWVPAQTVEPANHMLVGGFLWVCMWLRWWRLISVSLLATCQLTNHLE
jgi:hypothetical protein